MIEFAKVVATRVGTAARVVLAQLLAVGDNGDDAGSEPVEAAEVCHPKGFVSRPSITAHTEAVFARLADEQVVLFIIDKNGPALSDLEVGETQLYGAKEPTATVRIRATGDIEITPKSGRKVYVGGVSGSEPIALGTQVKNQLDSIRTAFNTHTHVVPGAQTGGPGITSNVPSGSIGATPDVEADNANAK